MRRFAVVLSLFAFLVVSCVQAAEEKPIPFWERPDYVLETPDIIEVKVTGKAIPAEDLTKINGTHLIGPDGHITLALEKKKSLHVQELTTAGCETALFELLSEKYGTDSLEVRVKVFACNSKEFHLVFQSEHVGEQKLSFPFTGHETVTKAIECCNGLVPEASRKMLVLRAAKPGKAVEMFGVDYDEALLDSKKDLALKSGDTILIRQNFRGEDLRPDGPIMVGHFGDNDDMLVTEDDYEFPVTEPAEVESKTASQVAPETTKPSGKRIARTVFFDGEEFVTDQYSGSLTPLCESIKPGSSISIMFQSGPRKNGFWLILYGDEETVTELHAVFKEIAEGK